MLLAVDLLDLLAIDLLDTAATAPGRASTSATQSAHSTQVAALARTHGLELLEHVDVEVATTTATTATTTATAILLPIFGGLPEDPHHDDAEHQRVAQVRGRAARAEVAHAKPLVLRSVAPRQLRLVQPDLEQWGGRVGEA